MSSLCLQLMPLGILLAIRLLRLRAFQVEPYVPPYLTIEEIRRRRKLLDGMIRKLEEARSSLSRASLAVFEAFSPIYEPFLFLEPREVERLASDIKGKIGVISDEVDGVISRLIAIEKEYSRAEMRLERGT